MHAQKKRLRLFGTLIDLLKSQQKLFSNKRKYFSWIFMNDARKKTIFVQISNFLLRFEKINLFCYVWDDEKSMKWKTIHSNNWNRKLFLKLFISSAEGDLYALSHDFVVRNSIPLLSFQTLLVFLHQNYLNINHFSIKIYLRTFWNSFL